MCVNQLLQVDVSNSGLAGEEVLLRFQDRADGLGNAGLQRRAFLGRGGQRGACDAQLNLPAEQGIS